MSATPAPSATVAATSTDDALGYDAYAYAKTLWARIEQALNCDDGKGERSSPKVLGDDPLAVVIFGERVWANRMY